jgi:hypothetical protein
MKIERYLLGIALLMAIYVAATEVGPNNGFEQKVQFDNYNDGTSYSVEATPQSGWHFIADDTNVHNNWSFGTRTSSKASASVTAKNPVVSPDFFGLALDGYMVPDSGEGSGSKTYWSITTAGFYIHSGSEYSKVVSPWGEDATFTAVGGETPIKWSITKNGTGTGNIPELNDGRTLEVGELGADGKNPVESGEYTVTATDKNGLSDNMKWIIIRADIDADADRDGTVESNDEDDQDEATWSKEKGAITYPGQSEDEEYNFEDPAIPTIVVRNLSYLKSKTEFKVYLKCSSSDKIMLIEPSGDKPVEFESGEYEVDFDKITAGDMTFKILSKEPCSSSFKTFELTLLVKKDDTTIAQDVVEMRIAPIIFPWNGDPVEIVYTATSIAGIPNQKVYSTGNNHIWTRDFMELGTCPTADKEGKSGKPLLDLKHLNVGKYITNMTKAEKCWQRFEYNNSGNGGDFEVTEPYGDYKYGKVFYGSNTSSALKTLVANQGIQSAISINTGWLTVGHVDEVMCFIGNKKVLVPSPVKAVELMHEKILKGDGAEKINYGYAGDGNDESENKKSFSEICIMEKEGTHPLYTLGAVTQDGKGIDKTQTEVEFKEQLFNIGAYVRIDDEILYVTAVNGNKITFQRGTSSGVGEDEYKIPSDNSSHNKKAQMYQLSDVICLNIGLNKEWNCARWYIENKILTAVPKGFKQIEIPVLFDEDITGLSACTSNAVNSLVVNGTVYFPSPYNQTFENYIKSQVKNSKFLEEWDIHMARGEIHCATNEKRTLENKKWWNQIK